MGNAIAMHGPHPSTDRRVRARGRQTDL